MYQVILAFVLSLSAQMGCKISICIEKLLIPGKILTLHEKMTYFSRSRRSSNLKSSSSMSDSLSLLMYEELNELLRL